jgi:hypothetical protein
MPLIECECGGSTSANALGDRSVALVVNTFERTRDTVLMPGFFSKIEKDNCRTFDEKVLLVNNVENQDSAAAGATRLLESGEITSFHFVAGHLDSVLSAAGLRLSDLQPMIHWSDCDLVSSFLVRSPYLLYWDADVVMRESMNWVDDGCDLLACRDDVLVVNARGPNWTTRSELTVGTLGAFSLGYGFSDQLWLARPEDFRRPIYGYSAPASAQYPTSHVCRIFEQRVDSYMRRTRRLRAVHLGAQYTNDGAHWYFPRNASEGVRFAYKRFVSRSLKLNPIRSSPAWKV